MLEVVQPPLMAEIATAKLRISVRFKECSNNDPSPWFVLYRRRVIDRVRTRLDCNPRKIL